MALPDQTQTTSSSSSRSSSHLYPQALQLKLYQSFIFSIPILFSIILFLLFYLFYLKRRASSLQSSSSPILIRRRTRSHAQASSRYVSSACQMDIKGELKEKLQIIPFDEELMKKDSQCCVCLGEFEMEEKLMQVQLCRHVFHVECIHHWLHNNTTCPLCRCSVIPMSMSSKLDTTNIPPLVIVTATAATVPPSDRELRQQHQQRDDNVSLATKVVAIGEESSSAAESDDSSSSDCGCSSTRDRDLGDSVTINIQDD